MDDQHLVVWLRIRFSSRKILELRYPYGDRVIHRFSEKEPVFANIKNEWIVIPSLSGRGLPFARWEELWEDLECEIDVWQRSTSTWKPVNKWKTLHVLMQWEERHAGAPVQKAAE